MKIVVCIRQGLDGEISPFDACAYEAALEIKGAEITLLSMGPARVKDFLLKLTRLGAARAVLLSDKAFAGADTLATAYVLSLAIKKLQPDLVFCGRQTLVGDTAQTGPMLSALAEMALITKVMRIDGITDKITCTTRAEGVQEAALPALLTIERINTLRLPRLTSKPGEVEVWSAADIGANNEKCGLAGSPTRVLETFENEHGKRKCKFISKDALGRAIDEGLKRNNQKANIAHSSDIKLPNVCIVGGAPREFAETISDDITVLPLTTAKILTEEITKRQPNAVLWGSDTESKRLAALVAAKLQLGLCADCTALQTDGQELVMYRPALSGSIIAKIKSRTKPAMATVRTTQNSSDIVVAAGYGVKDSIEAVAAFAKSINVDLAASRKAVDHNLLPYSMQVGLTGKTISPPVYIAIGISGAVHHIAGMQRAGTVIAINPDPNAPIFQYADYGILEEFSSLKY